MKCCLCSRENSKCCFCSREDGKCCLCSRENGKCCLYSRENGDDKLKYALIEFLFQLLSRESKAQMVRIRAILKVFAKFLCKRDSANINWIPCNRRKIMTLIRLYTLRINIEIREAIRDNFLTCIFPFLPLSWSRQRGGEGEEKILDIGQVSRLHWISWRYFLFTTIYFAVP